MLKNVYLYFSIMVAHFIIRKDLCLACKIFPATSEAPSRKLFTALSPRIEPGFNSCQRIEKVLRYIQKSRPFCCTVSAALKKLPNKVEAVDTGPENGLDFCLFGLYLEFTP